MIFFISGDWYSMFFLLIDEFKTLFYIQDYLIKRWFLILQKFSKCSKVLKPVKTGLTRSEKFYGTVVLYEILLWISKPLTKTHFLDLVDTDKVLTLVHFCCVGRRRDHLCYEGRPCFWESWSQHFGGPWKSTPSSRGPDESQVR